MDSLMDAVMKRHTAILFCSLAFRQDSKNNLHHDTYYIMTLSDIIIMGAWHILDLRLSIHSTWVLVCCSDTQIASFLIFLTKAMMDSSAVRHSEY